MLDLCMKGHKLQVGWLENQFSNGFNLFWRFCWRTIFMSNYKRRPQHEFYLNYTQDCYDLSYTKRGPIIPFWTKKQTSSKRLNKRNSKLRIWETYQRYRRILKQKRTAWKVTATASPTLWHNEWRCRLRLVAAVAWLVRRKRKECFFPSLLQSSLSNIVSAEAEMVEEEGEVLSS